MKTMLAFAAAAFIACTGSASARNLPVSVTVNGFCYNLDITFNTVKIETSKVKTLAAAKLTGCTPPVSGVGIGGISIVDLTVISGPFLTLGVEVNDSTCPLLVGLQLDNDQKLFTGGNALIAHSCDGKKIVVDGITSYTVNP
jgi:hypothetical protein